MPALAAAACALYAFAAQAIKADDDTLVEGAKLCTRYLPRHERQYGIPEHLLAAIASTESGRFHRALGLNLPWPWTINVEGAGHFYDTKEEAIEAVRSFQARGIASIDVGCMQVNLMHHPNAFASLDQAFDPAYNVAYAAQFLKQNFTEEGSWRKATADYHSHTPTYGEQYARLVYGAWGRIINKVADARAGRPVMMAQAATPRVYASGKPRVYHPMHMHDISIGHRSSRENGVLVIRPDSASAVVQQASLEDNSNDFTFYPRKAPQPGDSGPERSAIAPGGGALTALTDVQAPSGGARIVKVQSDGTVSNTGNKGQFEPAARVVHAEGEGAAASGVAVNASAGGNGNAGGAKNIFLFQ